MVTPVCTRCGYAVNVRRVMLMVEGRAMNEHKLCTGCLSRVFDVLQTRVAPVAGYTQAGGGEARVS